MSIGFLTEKSTKSIQADANIIPLDFTNAICYGQTGSGKTTGFILPNIDERMKAGQGMLIYVYKENFDGMVKALALKNNRLDDVLEIGTPWSDGINLLKECSIDELKTWFFSMSYERDYWKSSAFALLGSITKALNALYELSLTNEIKDYKEEVSLARVASFCDIKSLNKLHDDVYKWIKTINEKKYSAYNQENFMVVDKELLDSIKESGEYFDEESLKYNEQSLEYDDIFDYACYYDSYDYERYRKKEEEKAKSDCFILDELVESYEGLKNFSELEKTDGGCGNRGVMETLENFLSYAKTLVSLNKAQIKMDEIVNSNKIVIVNVGIMGENLARLFNICFTNKLISRLRNADNMVPWTIFIDEAHKIITKDTMPETSVCRESNFEYILCVQNKWLLAKALGIHSTLHFLDSELSILTQNIAYQLSFYDPLNELCAELKTHEFSHLENSKLSEIRGKAEPIFITNAEIENAQSVFAKNSKIFDKVLLSADLDELKYIKPLSAKTALVYYKNGSKAECKIMLKSQKNEAKQRAKSIIENKGDKKRAN